MEFNAKLKLLEKRFLDYKNKSILSEKKQKQLNFFEYATLFYIDDTNIIEEEELISDVLQE